MNDLFSLDEKVAIVAGGNGGIGKGIVRGFASMGADVAIVARNSQKIESAVNEIREAFGVRALGLICDVTDEKAAQQMVEEVHRELGRIDFSGKPDFVTGIALPVDGGFSSNIL